MTGNQEWVERRQEKRFRVSDSAFVVTTPGDPKVGRIIDISATGLAFAYIGRDEPLDESTEVSIFSEGCGFCVYKVPCDIISDSGLDASGSTPISIRQCRVKFGELEQRQISELKGFIQHYALGQT